MTFQLLDGLVNSSRGSVRPYTQTAPGKVLFLLLVAKGVGRCSGATLDSGILQTFVGDAVCPSVG